MWRSIRVGTGLAAVSLLAVAGGLAEPAAAGGGGGSSACDGSARSQTLVMRDSCFQGTAHFVAPDSTVTVRNEGRAPHDIVALDGSFSSPRLDPGATFVIEVGDAGVVPFYCSLHGTRRGAGMAGVLVAGEPSAVPDAALASARRGGTDAVGERSASGDTVAVVRAGDATTAVVLAGAALLVAGVALGLGARARAQRPSDGNGPP